MEKLNEIETFLDEISNKTSELYVLLDKHKKKFKILEEKKEMEIMDYEARIEIDEIMDFIENIEYNLIGNINDIDFEIEYNNDILIELQNNYEFVKLLCNNIEFYGRKNLQYYSKSLKIIKINIQKITKYIKDLKK